MRVLSIDFKTKKATIEWRNKTRELDVKPDLNETRFSILIAGRVGRTGTKLWRGYQQFHLKNGEWKCGTAYGGINLKAFTPVCFVDEVPDSLACKRR